MTYFLISTNSFEWDYGGYVTSWRGGKTNSNLLVTLQPGGLKTSAYGRSRVVIG